MANLLTRMLPPLLCLGLAIAPGTEAWAARAALPERKAVVIEDDLGGSGRFNVLETEAGGYLPAGPDADVAWQNLRDMLSRLRIPLEREDAAQRELVTGWVRWKVDPKTGRAFSEIDLLHKVMFTPLMEDHRFRMWIDTSTGAARLHIADSERMEEYQFNDDPGYNWIKWREAPPDPLAARTFLRHVQGVYEAVGATRLVVAHQAGPAPVSLVAAPSPAVAAAAPVTAQAAVSLVSAPPAASPAPSRPVAPPVAAPALTPRAAVPAPASAGVRQVVVQPAPVQPVAVLQPAVAVQAAAPQLANALLVRAPEAETWRALHQAMQGMEMTIATQDEAQGRIDTAWLDYRYDEERDRFERNPDESRQYFFGFSGPKKQRHTFQLTLATGEAPDTTLIYARQLAWDAQDFRTPGGGGELFLIWKTRTPSREAEMAFLRMLSTRLHLKQD